MEGVPLPPGVRLLLIELYGIETLFHPPAKYGAFTFNRTIWN